MISLFLHSWLFFAVALWPFNSVQAEDEPREIQLEIPANVGTFEMIRVAVVQHATEITLETNEPYQTFDGQGHLLFGGERLVSFKIRNENGKIVLGREAFYRVPIIIQSLGEGIQVNGRLYRNALAVWPEDRNQLTVVNEVPLEDYLRGVLPWEVSPAWPNDALKAQAIASRTYALFRAIERQNEIFDVSSDVSSQVYKGRGIEHEATDRAIRQTQGQILTYRGKIFPAYFHSTCGGATTRADFVWNVMPHPALMGVMSEFSRESKHYRWQHPFQEKDFLNVLNKRGHSISSIDRILLEEVDVSGRPRFISFEGGSRKVQVPANDFRIWMDPAVFKSTKISSIRKVGTSFIFSGFGWGHGVGMCQYSTKKLAELGYSYKQILDLFYPGADINQVFLN